MMFTLFVAARRDRRGENSAPFVFGAATAFALVSFTAPPLGAACTISGAQVTLHGITVQPKGVPPLTVGISELSVVAKPGASSGAPANLEVSGGIAFRGKRRRMWYSLAEPLVTNDGTLKLERGARLVDARASADVLLASVVLSASDTLDGTDLRPELVARPVRVACTQLTLDSPIVDGPNAPLGDDTWWTPRVKTRNIALRAAPDAHATASFLSVVIQIDIPPFSFERLAQRGGWMQIAYAGDSAIARGWVPRAEWVADPNGGGRTSNPIAEGEFPDYEVHYAVPARYDGPARIHAGTVVYAEPGRGPWATVRQSDGFRVHDDGFAWIQINHIPGVSVVGAQAYVRREAVELPQR